MSPTGWKTGRKSAHFQITSPSLSSPPYACGTLKGCGRPAAGIWLCSASCPIANQHTICRNVQYEFSKFDLAVPISLSPVGLPIGIISMLTEISYVTSLSSARYDGTFRVSCARLNGSSASRVITHGLIVLAKFFALNAPNGNVSGPWISRAIYA